jgi:hypothetical protein
MQHRHAGACIFKSGLCTTAVMHLQARYVDRLSHDRHVRSASVVPCKCFEAAATGVQLL